MNKKEMQELIDKLSYDTVFGCLTRQAVELRWSEISKEAQAAIFLDIDRMHEMNEKFGYDKVDQMIRDSIGHCRSDDKVVAARYYSGDELLFILKDKRDVKGFSNRMFSEFRKMGISITACIIERIVDNLIDTVKPAAEEIRKQKISDNRGILVQSV